MTEHELDIDLLLRSAARSLDVDAPVFDASRLRSVSTRRLRGRVLALVCIVLLTGVVAAPAAVSAIGDLFDVDEVTAIGPLEYGVAPPYAGRSVTLDVARVDSPFHIRTISSLGAPHDVRVRDDIAGGMVTLAYEHGWIVLTQWRTADVAARIAVVPLDGTADTVAAAGVQGLWTEGASRGTFSLVGADGTVHRESFDVGSGALLWKRDGMTYLLQGAGTRDAAVRLAADVDR